TPVHDRNAQVPQGSGERVPGGGQAAQGNDDFGSGHGSKARCIRTVITIAARQTPITAGYGRYGQEYSGAVLGASNSPRSGSHSCARTADAYQRCRRVTNPFG